MNNAAADINRRCEAPFNGDDLYVLPVAGAFVLSSPRRAVSALVNRKALEHIRERSSGNAGGRQASGRLQDLCEALDRTLSAIPDMPEGTVSPVFLGLIPTRACNLSCVYCGFGAGEASAEQMTLPMAVGAVDWIVDTAHQGRQNIFAVHFFGGEPFAAREVVEVAVHRARALAGKQGLEARFEVATNGVFDDDTARFAGHYFDTVVLSCDGPEAVHDRNRPVNPRRGSFARVARTAALLSASPVELCLRVCVTHESVGQMEATARWLAEQFQPSMINFETLQPTPESEQAGLRPPDPYAFAEGYMRSRRALSALGIEAVYASAVTSELRHSFCPVGKDAAIVSPDGRVSSCYLLRESWQIRGMDLDIGRFGEHGAMDLKMDSVERLRRLVKDKPRCESCFCRWTCAGGCHVNHSYPGSPLWYTDFCIQTRLITACSLLDAMGQAEMAERLLSDRTAMEALALAPSDRLEDLDHGCP